MTTQYPPVPAHYPPGVWAAESVEMTTQYPPGFWPAINKYFDPQGCAEVTYLRMKLERLRCMPRGLPKFFTDLLVAEVDDLKKEILNAVRDNNTAFLEKLSKAMQPEDPMDPVRAVLIGFENLFLGDALPTMAAVKRQAKEILKEKGHPIPRPNHWSRIFADAGLSDLPHGRPGRPSKK